MEKKLKYIFTILSLLLLAVMIFMSRDSGVNCDELLHYNHSVAVLKYYSTHGKDTSALNTPVTHLKYYGQSYDNFTTLITRIAGIEDIYGFRHFMSSLAGWLAIMITALFAIWLYGIEAGIAVLLFFAVSPTFLGHAQNNLKDIPFALSYIAGVWFIFRFLETGPKSRVSDIILLIVSIGFSISIRPGGLILICYLFLFFVIYYSGKSVREGMAIFREAIKKGLLTIMISGAGFFAGIAFWPFAQLGPVKNVLESYRAMAHFPDTFRQIFEGVSEYSDYMPWYYLPKSILITIPLAVLAGVVLYLVFSKKHFSGSKSLFHIFLLFTIIFPVILVIAVRSNLYSSWRHFLFVYPGLVLLAGSGLVSLLRSVSRQLIKWMIIILFAAAVIHPVKFLALNHRYAYLYYNELTGGLKGAYGKYETDYYYISQRESAEWLLGYLQKNGISDTITVGSNFSAEWFFRKNPGVKNRYIRFGERSMTDWDYAIITNRYIPPYQLTHKIWPPTDALHVVYADSVPISAVIRRNERNSLLGSEALDSNKVDNAINYFSEAVKADSTDDMIFYNFAFALFRKGMTEKADSVLRISVRLNPGSEQALMFLGDLASGAGKFKEAESYYEKTVRADRKFPEAFLNLASLVQKYDVMKAREILRNCIEAVPDCKPAINMLGDTYSKSDPEIAEKYYKLAKTIK